MARLRRLGQGLVAAMVLFASSVWSLGAPDFPPPPDAKVETVSASGSMNGVPISTRRFSVELPGEQVLEFYRKLWRKPVGGHPGFTEGRINEWQIISRIEGDYLLTVQVAEASYNQSSGYLALSDYRDRVRVVSSRKFPQMRDSVVVNHLTADDPGKKSETLLIRNEFSPTSNATYYRDHYLHRGWNSRVDQPMEGGHVMSYQRDDETIDIVIQQFGEGTYIVANQVRGSVF